MENDRPIKPRRCSICNMNVERGTKIVVNNDKYRDDVSEIYSHHSCASKMKGYINTQSDVSIIRTVSVYYDDETHMYKEEGVK